MYVYEFVCLYVCDVQASDVIVNDVLRFAYTSVTSFASLIRHNFLQLHLVSIDGSGICVI